MSVQSVLADAGVVFFDAVGTLIHPDPPAAEVYAAVGRRFGSRLSAAVIGPRFGAAFRREEAIDQQREWRTSEEREGERWRRIVASVLDDVRDAESCFSELFEHFSRPAAWRCDPGAVTVFSELARRGFSLGVASNYDRRLQRVLAGLSLPSLQFVVISSEVGWRKPSARFFMELSRVSASVADQTVYIGDDQVNDYDGARAAGLRAILLEPRGHGYGVAVERIERLTDLIQG